MVQTQQMSAFLLNPAILWLAPNGVTVSSGALRPPYILVTLPTSPQTANVMVEKWPRVSAIVPDVCGRRQRLSILWTVRVTHSYSKCFHVGALKAEPSERCRHLDSKRPPGLRASCASLFRLYLKIQPPGCYCKSTNTWPAWIFLLLSNDVFVFVPLITKVKLLADASKQRSFVARLSKARTAVPWCLQSLWIDIYYHHQDQERKIKKSALMGSVNTCSCWFLETGIWDKVVHWKDTYGCVCYGTSCSWIRQKKNSFSWGGFHTATASGQRSAVFPVSAR